MKKVEEVSKDNNKKRTSSDGSQTKAAAAELTAVLPLLSHHSKQRHSWLYQAAVSASATQQAGPAPAPATAIHFFCFFTCGAGFVRVFSLRLLLLLPLSQCGGIKMINDLSCCHGLPVSWHEYEYAYPFRNDAFSTRLVGGRERTVARWHTPPPFIRVILQLHSSSLCALVGSRCYCYCCYC